MKVLINHRERSKSVCVGYKHSDNVDTGVAVSCQLILIKHRSVGQRFWCRNLFKSRSRVRAFVGPRNKEACRNEGDCFWCVVNHASRSIVIAMQTMSCRYQAKLAFRPCFCLVVCCLLCFSLGVPKFDDESRCGFFQKVICT